MLVVKTRAVFFDLGGTLLKMRRDKIMATVLEWEGHNRSEPLIHDAYMKIEPEWVGEYSGKPQTESESRAAYARLDYLVLRELRVSQDHTELARLSESIRDGWSKLDRKIELELYPDAEPLLLRLKADGLILGLISNAPPETAETVKRLGLHRHIEHVVISGIQGYSKPNPEIFLHALRLASVAPTESVHVGDLYGADVLGARAVGMDAILLDRENRFSRLDCDRVSGLSEVPAHLKKE
jgi:putative hydrolase of the HAD superfamily